MAAPTQQEVTAVIDSYEDLQHAVAKAETVVFEEQNIEGTRYKYILSQYSEYTEGD